jgi:hypothetical protein
VLFSSSPLDRKEPTHINVHPPEHWAEQFARHGFYRDVDYDASFITAWATRFRRRHDPAHRLVRDYERRGWELLMAANEARSDSMQVQSELARVKEGLDSLGRALDAERRRYDDQRGHLERTVQALAQANDRVFHMERSLFWQARTLWTRLRTLFSGRP